MSPQLEGLAASFPGIPDNASGSFIASTFWTIVEVAATPHTVPSDRKRYTMEVDTACSKA